MKIGLLAIFRNESHILKEWLTHYVSQGIDVFYLINNASEDKFEDILKGFNVVLRNEPYVGPTDILELGGRQIEAYNEFLPHIDCDWLYVCDLDEFAYGRNGLTIKTFLEQYGDKFEQYLIPLKTFNSNDIIKQPSSVVKSFVRRKKEEGYALFKPLVKRSNISVIGVNYCTLKAGRTAKGDLSLITEGFISNERKIDKDTELAFRNAIRNGLMENSFLVSNHYSLQSKEWFFNVKATRGTATWHGGSKMPAHDWFNYIWNRIEKYDTVIDLELSTQKGYNVTQ